MSSESEAALHNEGLSLHAESPEVPKTGPQKVDEHCESSARQEMEITVDLPEEQANSSTVDPAQRSTSETAENESSAYPATESPEHLGSASISTAGAEETPGEKQEAMSQQPQTSSTYSMPSLSSFVPSSLSLSWFGADKKGYPAALPTSDKSASEQLKPGTAQSPQQEKTTDFRALLAHHAGLRSSASEPAISSADAPGEDSGGDGGGKGQSGKKAGSFHSFIDKLGNAPEIRDAVRARMASLGREEPQTIDPDTLFSVMSEIEHSVRAHPLWQNASRDELEGVSEGVERLVITKLKLFAADPADRAKDDALRRRIACLQFIEPKHLDIPAEWVERGRVSLETAKNEVCKMSVFKSPRDKIICIFNCCKLASNVLASSAERTTGADELLPLLIFLLIQANPPQLHSNLLFISKFRNPNRLIGEQGYFLTNIMSAQSFLESVCDDDGVLQHERALTIAAEDFRREYQARKAIVYGLHEGEGGGGETAGDWKREEEGEEVGRREEEYEEGGGGAEGGGVGGVMERGMEEGEENAETEGESVGEKKGEEEEESGEGLVGSEGGGTHLRGEGGGRDGGNGLEEHREKGDDRGVGMEGGSGRDTEPDFKLSAAHRGLPAEGSVARGMTEGASWEAESEEETREACELRGLSEEGNGVEKFGNGGGSFPSGTRESITPAAVRRRGGRGTEHNAEVEEVRAMAARGVLSEHSAFRFEGRGPATLSVADVTPLLHEYHRLLRIVRGLASEEGKEEEDVDFFG